MRLKDRVIIVTGGAQGIGAAYAKGLAREGARVTVADIRDPKPVSDALRKEGGTALPVSVDVSDEESVRAMADQTLKAFGRIDVLVNNAALFGGMNRRSFLEITVEEWDRVMAVNVRGIFLCCKAVVPQMIKQGGGKIINVASGTFYSSIRNFLHYTTSKGAVVGLTRNLARELGEHNITVNGIAPGFTWSEAGQEFGKAIDDYNISLRCLKRRQVPEDLVGTMIFLCSPESNFITGQTMLVCGGTAHV